MPLEDVLHHPSLYNQYPELKGIKVAGVDTDGMTGFYAPNTKTIGVKVGSNDPHGTILHEVQHAIQHIEGHASGANSKASKFEYDRTLGEIEARDTEKRRDWSTGRRAETEPYTSTGFNKSGENHNQIIVSEPFKSRIEQHQEAQMGKLNAVGEEQTDPALLDHIDQLKQDPRFWSDPDFRKNVIELARTREPVDTSPKEQPAPPKYASEAEARAAQNKFMKGDAKDRFRNLPIDDINSWRGIGLRDIGHDLKARTDALAEQQKFLDENQHLIGAHVGEIKAALREANITGGSWSKFAQNMARPERLADYMADRTSRIAAVQAKIDRLQSARSIDDIRQALPDHVRTVLDNKTAEQSGSRFMKMPKEEALDRTKDYSKVLDQTAAA